MSAKQIGGFLFLNLKMNTVMKKKALLLGFAGSMIGLVSCSSKNVEVRNSDFLVPVSGAGRVIKVDSANDRVILDTSTIAVTRNVRTQPELQVTGLFSKNYHPRKGDLLFFTIDSNSLNKEEKRIESFTLFPYLLN